MNKLKIDFTFNGKQHKLSIDVEDKCTQKYLESQMSLCGRYELDVRPIDLLCTYRQYLSLPTLRPLNADELQEAQAKEKIYNVITLENSCSVDEWFFKMIQEELFTYIYSLKDKDVIKKILSYCYRGSGNSDYNVIYLEHAYDIPAIFESAEFRKLFTAFSIHVEQNK